MGFMRLKGFSEGQMGFETCQDVSKGLRRIQGITMVSGDFKRFQQVPWAFHGCFRGILGGSRRFRGFQAV